MRKGSHVAKQAGTVAWSSEIRIKEQKTIRISRVKGVRNWKGTCNHWADEREIRIEKHQPVLGFETKN